MIMTDELKDETVEEEVETSGKEVEVENYNFEKRFPASLKESKDKFKNYKKNKK